MADRDAILDAIREAHQAGMKPSEVRRKLAAGTLDGIERPVKMSSSSFFRHWATVRREQAQAGRQGQQQAGESALAQLRRAIDERDEKPRRLIEQGLADGRAPGLILEEIVDSTRLTPEKANELLPPELRLDPDDWEFRRLLGPHMRDAQDQRHRGRQMLAEGASLEQIIEATGMNPSEAGIIFGSELAKSDAAARRRMET